LAHQLQLSVIELWWKVQKFREGAVLMPTKRMTSSKNQKHQRTKSKAPITTSRKRKEMRRGGDRHKAQTPRQSGRHKSRKGQQTHVVRKALERAKWIKQHLSPLPPTTSTETPQPVRKEMPPTISYSSSSSQSPSTPKLANATGTVPRAPTVPCPRMPCPRFGLWGWGKNDEVLNEVLNS
jgi:hypothetical protein